MLIGIVQSRNHYHNIDKSIACSRPVLADKLLLI